MNYNIICYIFYTLIMGVVVVRVGLTCYRLGLSWTNQLLQSNLELSKRLNQILLLAYYLLNLGYVVLLISTWEQVASIAQVIETIAFYGGRILLILAFLHVLNIAGIYFLFTRKYINH